MDGFTFFNKINFLYNRSSNYLKLIGFHNDFTYGITSKTYRMKELGLYILDDNKYFSSQTNKYIYYDKELVTTNKNELSKLLSTLVYISKKLNRIFIFPRFVCGRNKCAFVRIYNLEYYEKTCGKYYRENSFLYSKIIPSYLLENAKKIEKIEKENDINSISNIESHLIIITEINYFNLQYCNCFRNDDYWQKKYN